MAQSESKLFGRYHDLILLIVGFILTGYFGTRLSESIQDRSWKEQHALTSCEADRAESEKVFQEVSTLMDRRLLRMRRLLDLTIHITDEARGNLSSSISFGTQRDFMEMRSDYKKALYQWNDALNKNRALVGRYFGGDMEMTFMNQIQQGFIVADDKLTKILVGPITEKPSNRPSPSGRPSVTIPTAYALGGPLKTELDELNVQIYQFDNAMIEGVTKRCRSAERE
jgi:hypothetical protein